MRRPAIGGGVEFALAHFENSAIAAKPKPAALVVDHLRDVIIAQPLRGGDVAELAILQSADAQAGITDPEAAVVRGGEAADGHG
jgi:hypothetical protein